MTWVRKDDQYSIHRKVCVLSDAAYRLEDEALGFCAANRTDGRITDRELLTISRSPTVNRRLQHYAQELRTHQRWHRHDDPPCRSEHCAHRDHPDGWVGWVIHDYLAYNPSAEKAAADAKAKADRQRNWLEKIKGRRDASHDTSRDPPRDASHDTPRDLSADPYPLPPTPPRPAPKEGGGGAPAALGVRREATERPDAGAAKDRPSRPSPNGRPPPELRETLAKLAAKSRSPGRVDALTRLREATPDVPVPVEPESAAVAPEGGQPEGDA